MLGGLLAGGTVFALLTRAWEVPAPVSVRPLPGGPPELLGLAMIAGRAVLVWTLEMAPEAWVFVEAPEGPIILGAAAGLITSPPGAPCLVLPVLLAAATTSTTKQQPARPPATLSPFASALPAFSPAGLARPAVFARWQTLVLRHHGHAVSVPFAALDGIRPMPMEISLVPGAPRCVLGYAETVDGPVLLFDPAPCIAEATPAASLPGLIAVFRHNGSRLGIPCAQVEPGEAGVDVATRLSNSLDGRRVLDLAPLVRDVPRVPAEVQRSLLVCRAAGLAFAVAANEVAAILSSQRSTPVPARASIPIRSVCTHRGDVLPIFDAAERLGAGPSRALEGAPLLRLALPNPVALAVDQVIGLRSIAGDSLAPVAGDTLVAALAMLDGRPVPVCRAAALAGTSA